MRNHFRFCFATVLLMFSLFFSSFLYALALSSPQIINGQSLKPMQIFNQWGCSGANLSPELAWDGVPQGTKSFAVTMYDPDAPTGSGWWHWVMVNIPSGTRFLVENAGTRTGRLMPSGAQMQRNDFGFHGYGGACPPPNSMPHNYTITLYALDVENIGIPADASPALAGYFINQHKIAEATLVAPTSKRN